MLHKKNIYLTDNSNFAVGIQNDWCDNEDGKKNCNWFVQIQPRTFNGPSSILSKIQKYIRFLIMTIKSFWFHLLDNIQLVFLKFSKRSNIFQNDGMESASKFPDLKPIVSFLSSSVFILNFSPSNLQINQYLEYK